MRGDAVPAREATRAAFGVEIDGGTMVRMIETGSPLPARARRLFTTVADAQAAVEINILRTAPAGGGRAAAAGPPESLGRFLLSGIRVGRPGDPRIDVSIEIDRDGIVRASARDLDTGAVQEVAFSQTLLSGGEDAESLRVRVASLARRVREESGAVSRHDHPMLRVEIDDIVSRSLSAVSARSREDLLGYRSALETLLGEMRALRASAALAPRGAGGG